MIVAMEELLEKCLERLESGEDLDAILAGYPEQAGELRSLLGVILDGRQQTAAMVPPAGAQSLSRAKFLTAAAGLSPAPGRPALSWFHLRLATSALILSGIVILILLGTGWASADSLPGDTLYPVKRMVEQIQLNFVQDPPARLELEENNDDRRLAEAEQLNVIKRRQPVTFSGLLEPAGPGQWQVGSLRLDFPQGMPDLSGLIDAYVQITGYVDNDRVEVEEIQPRQLTWSGTLQKISPQSWLVGGVSLLVNGKTQILGGTPRIGQLVYVTAIRLSENRYLAVTLQLAEETLVPTVKPTQTKLPMTPTGTRAGGKCPGDDQNCQPTGSPSPTPKDEDDHGATATPPSMTRTPTPISGSGFLPSPTKASATPVPQVTRDNTPTVTSQPTQATATRQPTTDQHPEVTPTPGD